jgi:hypothetical protein
MGSSSERWRIRPLELPRPWRYCASCASAQAFVCSERFRVNAQMRHGQIYLLSKNDLTADKQNGGSSVL